MPVGVFTSADCLRHEPGAGYPEQPARLEAVLQVVAGSPAAELHHVGAAPLGLLSLHHSAAYLSELASMSGAGGGAFDADTPVMAGTWESATGAVGAALAAYQHATARGGHAFAAIRPPGHHALNHVAMGFCFLNQIALVASQALVDGRSQVLIVDWDVHHGNGTQALVESEPRIRFVSMHQSPWWPGSGDASERGCGNCFNLPMAAGLPRHEYREALWGGIASATYDWTPDLILVSAGYDGMRGDPLGGFTLEAEDFAAWTLRLREAFPTAPIIGMMEGGYAPSRLAAGVIATIEALQ